MPKKDPIGEGKIFRNMSLNEPNIDCDKCDGGVFSNTGERDDSYDQLLDGDFWLECDGCERRLLVHIEYTAKVTHTFD